MLQAEHSLDMIRLQQWTTHQDGGIKPTTPIMDITQITMNIRIQPIIKCGRVAQEIIIEHGTIVLILFRNAYQQEGRNKSRTD